MTDTFSNRQARALVLLAGNGAGVIFLGQLIVSRPELTEPARSPGEINALPIFLFVALCGVASGYVALVKADPKHRSFVALEITSTFFFVLLLAFLVLTLVRWSWLLPAAS